MALSPISPNLLLVFALILIIALIIPELFKRSGITPVPFYIIAGIVLGPNILGFHAGEGLVFLGEIGLLILVFISGLEIHELGRLKGEKIFHFSAISTLMSFLGGFVLGLLLGYSVLSSCLIGTIFISSSLDEIIPMVNTTPHVKKLFGDFLIPSIVVMDGISLITAGLLVKYQGSILLEILFILELALLVLVSIIIIPWVSRAFFVRKTHKPREADLRFVITVLMIVVALGYVIGVSGIVTAFLAGALLGRIVPGKGVIDKVNVIGNGLLIPVFFIVLGMQLDIGILTESGVDFILPVLLIATLVLVKLGSGIAYAWSKRYSVKDGVLLGIVTWPQLTATIAATLIGFQAGLVDDAFVVAVVILTLATTLPTPIILHLLAEARGAKIQLKDHAIVAGYNEETVKLAHILRRMEVPLIVMDEKSSRLRELDEYGIPTVEGNPASRRDLLRTNVQHAKLAILALPEEHDLYVAAAGIRKVNRECFIVAIIHSEEIYKRLKRSDLVDEFIWPERHSSSRLTGIVVARLSGE